MGRGITDGQVKCVTASGGTLDDLLIRALKLDYQLRWKQLGILHLRELRKAFVEILFHDLVNQQVTAIPTPSVCDIISATRPGNDTRLVRWIPMHEGSKNRPAHR